MSYERIIERKVFKKRSRRLLWKRQRNYYLNSLTKAERVKLNHNNTTRKFWSLVTMQVPVIFSTKVNIETVLGFITKCKMLKLTERHLLKFNFSKVEVINAGAMSLLLSVVQDLTDLKIRISGNVPIKMQAKRDFHDSGFLEYVYDERGSKAACKSKIIVKGGDKTEQKRTAMEIRKAMLTVFGQEQFNVAMQGAIIEMMANSVNHAFPENTADISLFVELFLNDKRWYLSVSHDNENKKVYFSFIDNGIGILKTIKRRFYQKVLEQLDNTLILKQAFDGKYKSSTKQKERGRGLPTVKDAFDKKSIVELKVVTNDHMYDFESNVGVKLNNSFEGTCYFWTLDETCTNGIS